MENEKKIKVAFIRGNSLNEWEGCLWNELESDFSVTGFCSQKNLYGITGLRYPIKRLASATDYWWLRQVEKFLAGRFQSLASLEKELANFDIAHTSEIFYFYTNQAVRAKKLNPKLKVVTTVWDNSFGRFEYNYWPGFKQPPKFWRDKIKA